MSKKGTDLGVLQEAAEAAAKSYRLAQQNHNRALDALNKAEAAHQNAQKALAAGLEQVRAATKVL